MLTPEEMLALAQSLEHKAAAAVDADLEEKYREVAQGWRRLAVQAAYMDALRASLADGEDVPDAPATSNIVYL